MYFAMDEIGIQNIAKIQQIETESERWRFIYDTAKNFGFDGIHFTPSLYREFGLDLHNIPSYFEEFKLTFHFGGYNMAFEKDYEMFDNNMHDSFLIAKKHRMHDVSIHPPYAYGLSDAERKACLSLFDNAIKKWAAVSKEMNIGFSLETHVSGEYFLFRGLEEYLPFVDKHPGLGILIDISHNYYDGYYEDKIIHLLGSKNVKALHISDTLQNADFRKGTHLAVGDGSVDFPKLLKHFEKFSDIFGVLEIKADDAKIQSSLNRLKNMIA
jgi:sugar phosphate isomerase/epimerase